MPKHTRGPGVIKSQAGDRTHTQQISLLIKTSSLIPAFAIIAHLLFSLTPTQPAHFGDSARGFCSKMQHLLSTRLVALNPISRPQVLAIETRQLGDEFVVGRTNFFTGEDTIISRRHAKFKITAHAGGPEILVVENLSMINGMLVNFRPIQAYQAVTIYDGDEIVSPFVCTCG